MMELCYKSGFFFFPGCEIKYRMTKIFIMIKRCESRFGGLEVACWPLVPKFAGSNPAEAVGFFRAKKKSSARLTSEGK